MFILPTHLPDWIRTTYHNYLKQPLPVELNPDPYQERADYVSCSSLARCPKAYAMTKKKITPHLPELLDEHNLPALMRMSGGTEAGKIFASAFRLAYPAHARAEMYLDHPELKLHGFCDVVVTDDAGQTLVIEVKKRPGYFNTPAQPRLSDCYQLLAYACILRHRGITPRLALVLLDGSDSLPVQTLELCPVDGGYELRNYSVPIIDDFSGAVISSYTRWDFPQNHPGHLNEYTIQEKIRLAHDWLSRTDYSDTPVADPLNDRSGIAYQCVQWRDGRRPKPNKVKPVVTAVCANCPFSCHFNNSITSYPVVITADGHAQYLDKPN
jgi:hypothetical protein